MMPLSNVKTLGRTIVKHKKLQRCMTGISVHILQSSFRLKWFVFQLITVIWGY